MIFDNKEQKDLILMCLNAVTIPGNLLEKMYELKQTIINAKIDIPEEKK